MKLPISCNSTTVYPDNVCSIDFIDNDNIIHSRMINVPNEDSQNTIEKFTECYKADPNIIEIDCKNKFQCNLKTTSGLEKNLIFKDINFATCRKIFPHKNCKDFVPLSNIPEQSCLLKNKLLIGDINSFDETLYDHLEECAVKKDVSHIICKSWESNITLCDIIGYNNKIIGNDIPISTINNYTCDQLMKSKTCNSLENKSCLTNYMFSKTYKKVSRSSKTNVENLDSCYRLNPKIFDINCDGDKCMVTTDKNLEVPQKNLTKINCVQSFKESEDKKEPEYADLNHKYLLCDSFDGIKHMNYDKCWIEIVDKGTRFSRKVLMPDYITEVKDMELHIKNMELCYRSNSDIKDIVPVPGSYNILIGDNDTGMEQKTVETISASKCRDLNVSEDEFIPESIPEPLNPLTCIGNML